MKLITPEKISASYHLAKYPAIAKNVNDRYCTVWQDNRRNDIYNIYAEVGSYDNVLYTLPSYYTNQKYDCVQPDVCADSTGRFHIIYAAFRGDLSWAYTYDAAATLALSGWSTSPPGLEDANNGILTVTTSMPMTPIFAAVRAFPSLAFANGYVAETKFKIDTYLDPSGTFTVSGAPTFYFRDGVDEVRITCYKDRVRVYADYSGGTYFEYYVDCTQWTTLRVTKAAGTSAVNVLVNGMAIYTSPLVITTHSATQGVRYEFDYALGPYNPAVMQMYLDYLYVNDTGPTLTGNKDTSDIGYVDFKQDGSSIRTSTLFTGVNNTSCYPSIKTASDDTLRAVWQGTLGIGGLYEILFARLTNAGALVSPPAVITTAGPAQHPHLAIDSSNNTYVVWDDLRTWPNEQIYIMKLDSTGSVVVAETQVSTTGKNYFPRIVLVDNLPVLVWHKYLNGKYQIAFQKLNASCALVGSEINISPESEQALYPDIMIGSDGYFHIVWHEYIIGEGFYIYYRIMDTANNFVSHHKRINWKQGDNRFPKIVDNGTQTAILLQDLTETATDYIYVTNINGFPDKGILEIGTETINYAERVEISSSMASVTSLTGTVNALVVAINVVSTQTFPTTGVLQVDSEKIYYSGKTLTSFTGCTRGFESTTAASHVPGSLISLTPQETILSAGIVASATTVPVVSTANFPASGSITIGSERIFYASKDATNFLGCIRGFEGSTASSHFIAVPASLNIYAFQSLSRGQNSTTTSYHVAGVSVATNQVYPKIVFHADSNYLYNYEIYDIHSENDAPLDVEIKDILSSSNYSFIYNATVLPEVATPPWTIQDMSGVEPVCASGYMNNTSASGDRWSWNIQTPIFFTYLSDEFDVEFRCRAQFDALGGPDWTVHSFYVTDGGNFVAQILVTPYNPAAGLTNNLVFFFGEVSGGAVGLQTGYADASNIHTYKIRYRRPSVEFLIDSSVIYSDTWDHPIGGEYVFCLIDCGFVAASAGSGEIYSAKILKNIAQVIQIPPITNVKSYLSNVKY